MNFRVFMYKMEKIFTYLTGVWCEREREAETETERKTDTDRDNKKHLAKHNPE